MAGSLHAESIYTPCTKWRRIGIGKNNAKQRKREAKQKQRTSKRGKTAFFSFFLFLQEKKRKENSLLIQIEYYIFFKPSGFLPQMKGSGKSFVSCPTMTVRIKGKKQRHIRVRKKVNKTKCLLCFSSSFLQSVHPPRMADAVTKVCFFFFFSSSSFCVEYIQFY